MKFVESLNRFQQTMSEPDVGPLVGLLSVISLGMIALGLYIGLAFASFVLYCIAAFLIGLCIFVIRKGMRHTDDMKEYWAEAAAKSWAKNGSTSDEVERRLAKVTTLGATAALAEAGIHYQPGAFGFNIDGTPMMAGGLDLHGNSWGHTNDDTFPIDLGRSYISMDPSDMGSIHKIE